MGIVVRHLTFFALVFGVVLYTGCSEGQSVDGTEFGDSNLAADEGTTSVGNMMSNGTTATLPTSNGTSATSNGTALTSNGTSNTSNSVPGDNCRLVLIEDTSGDTTGTSPGVNLDAIGVVSEVGGTEWFAVSVEDHNFGGSDNAWNDPAAVLGPPNAECEPKNFAALGGGYILVDFDNDDQEVAFRSGSTVTVYALGPTACPEQNAWTDDPYTLAISVANDRSMLTEIGTGSGKQTFTLP